MTVGEKLISPNDAFNQPMLKRALKALGDYVYGYYRPTEIEPFYVGKGNEDRVLYHWTDSFKGNLKYDQCKVIRTIIKLGNAPDIKILAHDLQSVVEITSPVLWSAYSKTLSVSNVISMTMCSNLVLISHLHLCNIVMTEVNIQCSRWRPHTARDDLMTQM